MTYRQGGTAGLRIGWVGFISFWKFYFAPAIGNLSEYLDNMMKDPNQSKHNQVPNTVLTHKLPRSVTAIELIFHDFFSGRAPLLQQQFRAQAAAAATTGDSGRLRAGLDAQVADHQERARQLQGVHDLLPGSGVACLIQIMDTLSMVYKEQTIRNARQFF